MKNKLDYSTAEPQNSYSVIPHKTLAKVRIKIKKGYYNDEARGWIDDWATKSEKTGAIYLNCEFIIVGGEYDTRKVWSLIGLHSEKSLKYEAIGASLIRTILESANGIDSNDKTEAAKRAKSIKDHGELNGMEFVAQIDTYEDQKQIERNHIRYAITKGHNEYHDLMYPVTENGRHKINKGAAPANGVIEDDEMPF